MAGRIVIRKHIDLRQRMSNKLMQIIPIILISYDELSVNEMYEH